MKKFIYILSSIVFSITFLGCDENDLSPVIDESAKPTVTLTSATTSINESGSPTFTFTIQLDKPIKTTTSFSATQVGGNATEGIDFELDNAVIPAYVTSTTMEVVIFDDITVEGDETIELQIAPNNVSDSYEVLETPTITINIENNASDDFLFKMDWDAIYLDSDGHEHHLCDFDFDLELYDSDFNLLDASYSSCPEEILIPAGELADGDYWLVPSFWTAASGTPPAEGLDFPTILTLGKPGVTLESVDLTGTWNSVDGGFVEGNPDAYLVKYVLSISGTTYTVTDVDTGIVVFQG